MPQTQDFRLQAILSERLLEIPDYQRPFAWGPKQLTDLWEDLDLLGPTGTHYAGTLVLRDIPTADGSPTTSMDDDGDTLRHCQVVDGQQRLISCLLLLDRTRRRLEILSMAGVDGAGKIARNIRSRYGMVNVGNVPVPKLQLGTDLNAYWKTVVLGDEPFVGPPLIVGQQRLKDASKFFETKLDVLAADATPIVELQRLRELQRRITDGLSFLVEVVPFAVELRGGDPVISKRRQA